MILFNKKLFFEVIAKLCRKASSRFFAGSARQLQVFDLCHPEPVEGSLQKSFAITSFIFIIVVAAHAGNTILTDEKFPYRVVCNTEWVQQEKNDTILILHNTAPGKRTRLQLRKFEVEPGYDKQNKEWSRYRYFINYDITMQHGKIMFVDTSSSKKLGGFRAYEIFALFWEKTDETTLWLAEYIRWTDNNGFGYMVSVIGDTLDMKENVKNKNYVNFLDSITLSQFSSSTRQRDFVSNKMVTSTAVVETPVWYDILGRNVRELNCQKPKTIIVKKNMKHSIAR